MTAHAVVRSCHFTLVAATVDTVTFSQPGSAVKVTNRDATQVLYFRTDGTAAVSAADDTFMVPAGVGNAVIAGLGPANFVSIISSAGGACSVESYSHSASAVAAGSATVSGTVTTAESQTKAEDVASANADPLFPIGVVRRDSAASSSTTDGDWSTLNVDATGRVWANVSNTVATAESGTWVQVDDAAFTPATSKIAMAGFQADETATDSVDEGDGGAVRMTLDRKLIVTPQPHTAGGLTTAMFTGSDGSSILTNAAQVIKASAGQLYGYYIYNPNSSATFVHFYNTAAASVTVGTTNPLISITLPATAAANLALPHGITFSNAGWSIATTTTAGGNSAPSTGLDAVVWYV